MEPIELLLNQIAETLPADRRQLRRLKLQVASKTGSSLLRNEALLARYRHEVSQGSRIADARIEHILQLNAIRSESGIATVTVITKPYACPGRCVYCPTEARAPKSYLVNEPAVMRALRSDYDPYGQVLARLEALDQTGHPTDKIELIIKGGTWSFYPEGYQRWFIRRCFDAANDFRPQSARGAVSEPLSLSKSGEDGDWSALLAAQQKNETAHNRVIGVTIETRPDHVSVAEIIRLRRLGVTRVELGVQSLEEAVLDLIVRDHGTEQVRHATRLLKDAAFKVAYHLMPNLPGATPESDLASAAGLFSDEGYQPDTMKLYPCVVIETAELHDWWRSGRYVPYDDETLIRLLSDIKQQVPPYVRIERVIRDIPSTSIVGGCSVTNLREEVHRRMKAAGRRCRCIRCRQVRGEADGTFSLMRRDYAASGGREVFLSFEDEAPDRIASLLRLRIPAAVEQGDAPVLSELAGAALVREVHSYGLHVPIHERDRGAVQHQGFGLRLMAEAERLARDEFGFKRIAVIAGIGAREYYRKSGYVLEGTYMCKALAR